jgi:hypothetical protein
MLDFLYYAFLLILLAGIALGGWLFVNGYITGKSPTSGLFGPRPEKRLDIVEQSNLDGRRRLVLIRRDDVEHLIMTGGPVDVVIETGIGQRRSARASAEVAEAPAAVFSRPARTFGQAVGEN